MKVLVITTTHIGDCLLSFSALKHICETHASDEVHVLTAPGLEALLKAFAVKQVWAWQRKGWDYIKALLVLRKERFDTVYLLDFDFSSALFAFLLGAPERVGAATESRAFLLTRSHPIDKKKHHAYWYLDGVGKQGKALRIPPFTQIRGLRHFSKNAAVLAPFSTRTSKTLEESAAVAALRALKTRFKTVYLIGTKKDKPMALRMQKAAGENEVALRFGLDLKSLCRLILESKLLITVDSGIMHLAAQYNFPTLAVFTSTNPRLTGPQVNEKAVILSHALACMPCYGNCKTPLCNQGFSQKTFEKMIDRVMKKTRASKRKQQKGPRKPKGRKSKI